MDDTRSELVRRKNRAFLDLDAALTQCEKRWHTSGHIPDAWRARLDELATAYQAARSAWQRGRSRWTG